MSNKMTAMLHCRGTINGPENGTHVLSRHNDNICTEKSISFDCKSL